MTTAKCLTMVLLGLLALAAPPVLAEGPERIDLPAPRMGTVPFPHELHQERAESCEVCHHKGVESGPCHGCHDLGKGPPQGRDLFHKICKDCHKKEGGPTACNGCHSRAT